MLLMPYFKLLFHPIAGGVIAVAGYFKLGFREKLGFVKAVYTVPSLSCQLLLGGKAEVEIVEICAPLAAAVLSAHFKIFKFGYFKDSFVIHIIIPFSVKIIGFFVFYYIIVPHTAVNCNAKNLRALKNVFIYFVCFFGIPFVYFKF